MNITNECKICFKQFKFAYLLTRHENNKKSCDNKVKILRKLYDELETIEKKIINLLNESFESNKKCFFCNNEYLNRSNLKRHINIYCDKKKELDNEKNKILNKINNKKEYIIKNNKETEYLLNKNKELIKKNEELENRLKKTEEKLEENSNSLKNIITSNKSTTIINNTQQNNVQNNVNNNINIIVNNDKKINSFGKEDLSHITNKDYTRYLSKYFDGFIEYIEKVHFSKEKPENHNICIPKINLDYVAVYEEDQWNLQDKNDLTDKLLSQKILALTKKCDELEGKGMITEKIVDKYNEFNANYYIDSENSRKKLEKNISLLLFNNRKKIKDYDKLLK